MPFQIYLVEDEENLNELLASYLKKEGWEVHTFLTGEEAEKCIADRPHLWILDIMLPDIDGYQLLKEIKSDCATTPVIFISARDAELDRVVGLEMGSDDYLAKPFLPRELVIRTHRLLERIYSDLPIESSVLNIFPYLIDEERRIVKYQDSEIDLTAKEFDLLHLFCKHPGQALSREQILDLIWGEDYYGSDRVVDDLIRRLRKKMPQFRVETIYGYGYRMVKG
ncbi:MAG: response regulator transcription factor [Syntrophomonadaceae bacterium]|jgi:two-component system response regulator CssR